MRVLINSVRQEAGDGFISQPESCQNFGRQRTSAGRTILTHCVCLYAAFVEQATTEGGKMYDEKLTDCPFFYILDYRRRYAFA